MKNKYKFLSKLIRSDSLQTELVKIGEDFDSIIGNFGKHLYSLNGEELIYSSMGERLSSQRNNILRIYCLCYADETLWDRGCQY